MKLTFATFIVISCVSISLLEAQLTPPPIPSFDTPQEVTPIPITPPQSNLAPQPYSMPETQMQTAPPAIYEYEEAEIIMPHKRSLVPDHVYDQPVMVGEDQLQHHLGHGLPGGYDNRAGSPYFNSVPGHHSRGPLPIGVQTANPYYVAPDQIGLYSNGAGSAGAGGDPYQYHFGPGYYRHSDYGHYRFPYYSYRRPWYHPGFAGYNRDTNLPW